MSLIAFKDTADHYKLSPDSSDSNLGVYNRVYSGLKVNIQPAGLEYVATSPDGAMGRTFRGFTSYSGVQIGDMIVSSGTTTVSGMKYSVTGIEKYSGPLGDTFEMTLRLNVR